MYIIYLNADISKPPLLSDSAATRQPAATGTLVQVYYYNTHILSLIMIIKYPNMLLICTQIQRQLLLSPPRKNKHPLSQGMIAIKNSIKSTASAVVCSLKGAAQDILQRKGRPKHRLPHTISTPQVYLQH